MTKQRKPILSIPAMNGIDSTTLAPQNISPLSAGPADTLQGLCGATDGVEWSVCSPAKRCCGRQLSGDSKAF